MEAYMQRRDALQTATGCSSVDCEHDALALARLHALLSLHLGTQPK